MTSSSAITRFQQLMIEAQSPASEQGQQVSSREASAALYPLYRERDTLDREAVREAVRSALASAPTDEYSERLLREYASEKGLKATSAFRLLIDQAQHATSDQGATITAGELREAIAILASPAIPLKYRQRALAHLHFARNTDARLTPEAEALLADFFAAHPEVVMMPPLRHRDDDRLVALEIPTTFEPAPSRDPLALATMLARFAAHPGMAPYDHETRYRAFFGHAFSRHLDKQEPQMRERLAKHAECEADGVFDSQAIALQAIASAITHHRLDVHAWLDRSLVGARLAVDVDCGQVVGHGIVRGDPGFYENRYCRVVLQKVEAGLYRILTAYPMRDLP